jgi:hypothetical protein
MFVNVSVWLQSVVFALALRLPELSRLVPGLPPDHAPGVHNPSAANFVPRELGQCMLSRVRASPACRSRAGGTAQSGCPPRCYRADRANAHTLQVPQ